MFISKKMLDLLKFLKTFRVFQLFFNNNNNFIVFFQFKFNIKLKIRLKNESQLP